MGSINQRQSETKIDEESVTKNSNSEIQVSKPKLLVIGDWKDSQGDWTTSSSGEYTPNFSFNDHARIDVGNGNFGQYTYGYIERTVDLSSTNELKFNVSGDTGGDYYNTTNHRIRLDGTRVFGIDDGETFSGTVTVDVSGYGASTKIEIYSHGDISGSGGSGTQSYIEVSKIFSSVNPREENDSGSGTQ